DYFGSLNTYLARSDGTFVMAASSATPPSISSQLAFALVITDMTADGNQDIVVFYSSEALSIAPGRGDGTFDSAAIYTNFGSLHPLASPSSVALGDLNGDGSTDVVVTHSTPSLAQPGVSVLLGIPAPFLRTRITHNGDFFIGQDNAVFTVQVSNAGNAVTAGKVTLQDALETPAAYYFDVISIAGQGWACTGTDQCSREDVLQPGASYPPVIVHVDVGHGVDVPVGNRAVVGGGGAAQTESTDSATLLQYQGYCLF